MAERYTERGSPWEPMNATMNPRQTMLLLLLRIRRNARREASEKKRGSKKRD